MTDLMKELEGIEQAALDDLSRAAKLGEGVELPFAATYWWALNGQRSMSALARECPALFYGGWATDADKYHENALDPVQGVHEYTGSGDKGQWNALATRVLHVAIIARRTRWLAKDGMTFSVHYKPGFTRQHLQVLTLGFVAGKAWFPVVLSAKGYQAKYLLEAIKAWEKAIAPFKKELNATQFPVSCFVISLGTTGDKPEFVSVGKTGAQSTITPIQPVIPNDLDAGKLAKRFVGRDVIRINAERLAQAQDWLKAWHVASENGERNEYEEPEVIVEEPF